jgi:hypothetical protein
LKYNESPMHEKFKNIEKEFLKLKHKYRHKKISEREFKDRLKKLRLNDKNGRCWTIGARSGNWYFFDGRKWVESKPPTLQEGKAICIFCGFENDLKNEACDYCGKYSCPKCGFGLNSPSQECPDCKQESLEPEAETSISDDDETRSTDKLPDSGSSDERPKSEEGMDWRSFDKLLPQDEMSEERYFKEDYNSILRSLSPASVFFFMGILGIIFGFIFGVFVGASNFFLAIVRILPEILQSIHGKLLGGVVFGILGGMLGFLLLGIIGFLQVLLVNVILSFFGGIKVRIDRFSS